jgi:tRNA-binding protein
VNGKMIFTYNKEHVGDVLMVEVAGADHKEIKTERKENIA